MKHKGLTLIERLLGTHWRQGVKRYNWCGCVATTKPGARRAR